MPPKNVPGDASPAPFLTPDMQNKLYNKLKEGLTASIAATIPVTTFQVLLNRTMQFKKELYRSGTAGPRPTFFSPLMFVGLSNYAMNAFATTGVAVLASGIAEGQDSTGMRVATMGAGATISALLSAPNEMTAQFRQTVPGANHSDIRTHHIMKRIYKQNPRHLFAGGGAILLREFIFQPSYLIAVPLAASYLKHYMGGEQQAILAGSILVALPVGVITTPFHCTWRFVKQDQAARGYNPQSYWQITQQKLRESPYVGLRRYLSFFDGGTTRCFAMFVGIAVRAAVIHVVQQGFFNQLFGLTPVNPSPVRCQPAQAKPQASEALVFGANPPGPPTMPDPTPALD